MKKLFSFVLFVILILAVSVTAFAASSDTIGSGTCGINGDNLRWELYSNGCLVIKGSGEMRPYGNSRYYNGEYVTDAPWGEYFDELKSIDIEEGITVIGEYAFFGCSGLTGDLVIPDSVIRIGMSAFDSCTGFDGNLVIGNNVEYIGENAFWGCSGFTGDLIIPDSVTAIGSCVFNNCKGFTGNLVIGNGIKTINEYTFYGCENFEGNLVIGNNVESIGNFAFAKFYKISGDLVIPDKVKSIGESAFWFGGFNGNLVLGNNLTTIGKDAFEACENFVGSTEMPESITNIGSWAFSSCGVDDFYFTGKPPKIGDYSFESYSDTIYYPEGNSSWYVYSGKWNGYTAVSYESYIATGYCGGEGDGTNLEWTLTGNGVLTISGEGRMADYETISLYGGYDRLLGSTAPWFEYMDSVYFVKKVVMEDGITHIGNCAFYQMHTGDNCFPEIPNTVKSIGSHAFYLMEIAAELTIPEGTEIIGQDAFGANTIYKMIIPATIEEISFDDGGCPIYEFDVSENNAFFSDIDGILFSKDKKTLIQVTPGEKEYFIPEGTEVIGNGAFYSSGRSFVVIPESVKKIESTAFSGFDGELIVEGKLDYIEMWAFVGFSGKSVNIYFLNGSPEAAQIEAFKMGDYYFINLYYLSGTENLWNFDENGLWNGYEVYPFGYCGGEGDGTNLKWALTEDGTLTIFGKGEMEKFTQIINPGSDRMDAETPWRDYSSQIKSIELSDGVTTINNFAFNNLNLTGEIVIPSSVKEIGMFCFSGNKFSGDLVIPEGVEKIGRSAFMMAGDFGTAYIPSTLIEIIDNPFRYCELEEIVVHNNNPNYCSVDGVLFSKDQTVIYQFPHTRTGEYIVPNSVSIIEECAFEKSCLSKIVINGDIEYINNVAFAHNQNNLKIIFNGKVGTINNAIIANFANAEIYFMNGAPKSVYEFNGEWGGSFSSALGKTYTIYCVDDGSWELDENGLWNGYEVKEYNGYGDINIDFTVDVKDVYLARLIAAKLVVPTEMESSFGDVDGDGKVTAIDANLIRKFCANIITKFPVE